VLLFFLPPYSSDVSRIFREGIAMNHLASRFLLTVVVLLVALLSTTVARAEFQKTKIAVLDFEMIGDNMETASLGAIISEWFITGIVKSGRFDVVERAMLLKILAEQKLGTSGMIDEQSAAALGKVLGVKAIISGSLLKLQDAVEINARVISVENGAIIAAENIRSSAKSDLHALVDELIDHILLNFPLTGYVVRKGDKTAIVDLGLDSGLTSGTEFIVYREGEVIKHPKTGEVLEVEHVHTGRLRIVKVSKNVAEATIVSEEGNGGIQHGQMVKSIKKDAANAKGKEKVSGG
jgi:TolB-like protein